MNNKIISKYNKAYQKECSKYEKILYFKELNRRFAKKLTIKTQSTKINSKKHLTKPLKIYAAQKNETARFRNIPN